VALLPPHPALPPSRVQTWSVSTLVCSMFAAQPLPGLPPYGPKALSFPEAGAFSEGFVVEFNSDGEKWVGNFAYGWGDGPNSVHTQLGAHSVFVVAEGAGYLIDAATRNLIRELGPDLQMVLFLEDIRAFVVSDGLGFEAFDALRTVWRSRRVSWDGIRDLSYKGRVMSGEAYDPTCAGDWLPFSLDLITVEVTGGSYTCGAWST
ncbi:MAG: hypothetical protein JWP15_2286, partial [Alphaproteobacteria bacterium]|nr:hypothetical protein [Alphaproteobacteria bacterium]